MLYNKVQSFKDPCIVGLEKIVGKGENAGNKHFLLFPLCFLPRQKPNSILKFSFSNLSANAFNLAKSKFL